jgi:hypothetical protein
MKSGSTEPAQAKPTRGNFVTGFPKKVKKRARERAGRRCEYCLLPEHPSLAVATFHYDHIIPKSAGGGNDQENCAYCCPRCNAAKWTYMHGELAGKTVRLFNPRTDEWRNHFKLDPDSMEIIGLTEIGKATVGVLQLNRPEERLVMRKLLRDSGAYREI